jgi:hypothetical protein
LASPGPAEPDVYASSTTIASGGKTPHQFEQLTQVNPGAFCSPGIGMIGSNPRDSFHRILTKTLKNSYPPANTRFPAFGGG